MSRLQIVWLAIVGFLPLYGLVGSVLVGRPEVGQGGPEALYVGLVVAFTVFTLVARRLLGRAGLASEPAHFVAWASAEAVAIVGLVAWVESGDVRAYVVGAVLSFALMVLTRPTGAAPPQQA